MPKADLGDQLLEPEPPIARCARAAEILVDHASPTPPATPARSLAASAHTAARVTHGCARPASASTLRYDVGEVPLRVLFRRRPPEPGGTVSDHRALQWLCR